MAIVNGSLQSGYKDSAWFTANPTVVLKEGQIVYLEQTGTYKLGDGVTQLSALTFLGGGGTVDVNTIGAAINGAISATPNDTDLVMSVDTSVAKKNTWAQIKAFLKTYFDTVYATITDLTGYVKKGTLTTNYIPKATASDTIGNSQITDDGTTVAIGSTSILGSATYQSGVSTLPGRIKLGVAMSNDFHSYTDTPLISWNGSKLSTAVIQASYFLSKPSPTGFVINNSGDTANLLTISDTGVFTIPQLTASQIVETDASKNLVSAAKGTAYNKNFGTTSGTVTEGGTTVLKTGDSLSGALNKSKSSNIASAATTDLSTSTGNYIHITGTTTITSFGTLQAGAERTLVFDDVLTLTHNGTSLILPNASNITTKAGDSAIFVSEGSGNWRCVAYQDNSGVGTWSPTYTGFSVNPSSVTAEYILNGDICTVWLISTAGTSNLTTFTFTLPFSSKYAFRDLANGINSGIQCACSIICAASSNVVSVYVSPANAAFANLGGKNVYLTGFSFRIA